jgi:two-component system chemotaxis sensor kinase CheA
MDELLGDFLTETAESLDLIDLELVRFEQEPNNAAMLNTIFAGTNPAIAAFEMRSG